MRGSRRGVDESNLISSASNLNPRPRLRPGISSQRERRRERRPRDDDEPFRIARLGVARRRRERRNDRRRGEQRRSHHGVISHERETRVVRRYDEHVLGDVERASPRAQ